TTHCRKIPHPLANDLDLDIVEIHRKRGVDGAEPVIADRDGDVGGRPRERTRLQRPAVAGRPRGAERDQRGKRREIDVEFDLRPGADVHGELDLAYFLVRATAV